MQQQIEQPNFDTQIIPQSKKFYNEKLPKEYKISIQLITQTSLDKSVGEELQEEEKIEAVVQLKSIHLQWLNIRKIQKLQVFTSLKILYLQHVTLIKSIQNCILKIQNLECLTNLQYLALNNNLIAVVEGLRDNKKLQGLNLNHNKIQKIQVQELPTSLQYVSFKNNGVTKDNEYKGKLMKALPVLEVLDGEKISSEQRLKTVGRFPQHLVVYSQRMNQFRKEQKLKKQQEESQKRKQLWFNDDIDENEVLKEIRERTRSIIDESKQWFQNALTDQKNNYELQMKMSKKIRDFKRQNYKNKEKRLKNITETNQENYEQK